jgi:hypothetical protein
MIPLELLFTISYEDEQESPLQPIDRSRLQAQKLLNDLCCLQAVQMVATTESNKSSAAQLDY